MITRKRIEKVLKESTNVDVKIDKGEGYYHYYTDKPSIVDQFEDRMILVTALNHLTIEQWEEDFKFRIKEALEWH